MARTQKYTLTDAHRAQLQPWTDRWIANALSTAPMTDDDRVIMRRAVRGLYEAAGLVPPPDQRIVFVPSPFVARVAAGFAAAIWYLRQSKGRHATSAATDAATSAATADATYAATAAATADATAAATAAATADATSDATYAAATYAATDAATSAATDAATSDATAAATYAAATADATSDATYAATSAAIAANPSWYVGMNGIAEMARRLVPTAPRLAMQCAVNAYRCWQGGNQWSGWVAFLSFFRHVAQLPLDYHHWDHYEQAAIHAGPRLMYAQFCIISDRPRVLTVDQQSRPHNSTGPFCRWADGTALYAWHGVRVPWWVIEHPERVTAAVIDQEENAEVRRAMIERIGWDVYLAQIGARPVQTDRYGALYQTEVDDARVGVVVVTNSTPEPDGSVKRYALLVSPEHRTAHAAVASTFGLTVDQYHPAVES